jgi:hypothetical protein
MTPISISRYRSEADAWPTRTTTTWEGLVVGLARPRRTPCTVASCARSHCLHKRGPAWSPATYPAGVRRSLSAVETMSLLVLDIDHVATDERLAEIEARLTSYRRIIHASHSDRPADRCVRIVLMLSRPVSGPTWPNFWRAAIEHLGAPADRKARDASRLYFLPSRPKDAGYRYVVGDGDALDVDAVLGCAVVQESEIATSLLRPSSPHATTGDQDIYAALAELDQGAVLLEVSGSELVGGETITLGEPDRRGHRAIFVDGQATSGFVDDKGRIVHEPSTKGARDGGPLVSTWCRYYGRDDRTIRRMLCELVSDLRRYAADDLRRSISHRAGPSPRDLRGDR